MNPSREVRGHDRTDRAVGDVSLPGKMVLLSSSAFTVMAGALIAPALPAIKTTFARTPHVDLLAPLVLTLPSLVIAALGVAVGWLVDRLGARRVLALSLGVYALAGSGGLWVPSLAWLLVSRIFLGVAVAGVTTAATTLIAGSFTGRARQAFMGMQAACMGFGGVLFQLAGGGLAELGWRGPFLAYLVPIVILPGIMFLRPPATQGEGSPSATRASRPRIPWLIIGTVLAMALAGMVLFYLIPVHLPFVLEERLGCSAAATGATLALFNLCAAVTSLAYPWIRRVLAPVTVCVLLFTAMAACEGLLAVANHLVVVLGAMVVGGVGLGALIPNLNVWLTDHAPPAHVGRLLGMLSSCIYLGQFLSPVAAWPLIQWGGRSAAFGAAAAGSLLIAVLFLVLRVAVGARPSARES